MATGFVGPNNKWYLEEEYSSVLANNPTFTNPEYQKRLDSRGLTSLNSGFLFAVGKTFKSGKMNIPFNLYVVPGASGVRFGASFGWNGHDRFEVNK